jgi:hypothetical protein
VLTQNVQEHNEAKSIENKELANDLQKSENVFIFFLCNIFFEKQLKIFVFLYNSVSITI